MENTYVHYLKTLKDKVYVNLLWYGRSINFLFIKQTITFIKKENMLRYRYKTVFSHK